MVISSLLALPLWLVEQDETLPSCNEGVLSMVVVVVVQ
jgi:hypothetical protein